MLSTLSAASQHQQFPVGSVIQYAPDEQHRPLFATSRLSGHTRNMLADSRSSLTVLRPGWQVGRGPGDLECLPHVLWLRQPHAAPSLWYCMLMGMHPHIRCLHQPATLHLPL